MWTVLAPYEVVSSKLKEKYHRALQVSFINNRLHVEDRLRLCFFGIETALPVKKNLLNIMLFIVIPIQDTEHRNDI